MTLLSEEATNLWFVDISSLQKIYLFYKSGGTVYRAIKIKTTSRLTVPSTWSQSHTSSSTKLW